jgi:hypothetical protein
VDVTIYSVFHPAVLTSIEIIFAELAGSALAFVVGEVCGVG